ncbi:MAG: VOC family protein [Pantoea sp.]|nr:VOC family protein [Pantoea sp.]
MEKFVSADILRERFSQAMSTMYQQEVPQYGTLLQLVADVNQQVLAQDNALAERLTATDELARLSVERHGAIRVGSSQELSTLRQLFAIMGMYPVGYYDLAPAGVPVHSTAFRPHEGDALRRNPFRHQRTGGFDEQSAEEFVREALETFRWHRQTIVDRATWEALHQQHRLIADVVCFPGCHINHLTPRTLDIDRAQALMPEYGITPKAIIEGPPRRQVPLLLRQTSFKALEEPVIFQDGAEGRHTARFGEIEQRGVALTPAGRERYDRLLAQAGSGGGDNQQHQQQLARIFSEFPDNERELRQQQLAWFEYRLTEKGRRQGVPPDADCETLIEKGMLTADPQIYEDFLPVSAAGIFQSNLGEGAQERFSMQASRADFEAALGCEITDEMSLYAARQAESLRRCGLNA